MKYELKIEFKHNQELESAIQKSYFENDTLGKLTGKKGFVTIQKEDPHFIIFRGLNNMTVKLINEDLIDGSMRCIVDEYEDIINLFPINSYCIIEDEKYSFY